jgi:hypothetical protein
MMVLLIIAMFEAIPEAADGSQSLREIVPVSLNMSIKSR